MRIPTYENQVGAPRIPELQTSVIPDVPDLSTAIDFVAGQFEQYQKDQDELVKATIINEKSRASLELDQYYAELSDAIQNGGSYADAEKKFNKKYADVAAQIQNSLGAVAQDRPDIMADINTDLQRSGVEYGLRLKDQVRSRVKSDAKSMNDVRLDGLRVKLTNAKTETERAAVFSEMSGIYAQGEAINIYPKGYGQVALAKELDNFVEEQIKVNPSAFLADYKKSPKKYSGISYLEEKVLAAKQNIRKQEVTFQNVELAKGVAKDAELEKKSEDGTLKFSDLDGRTDEYAKYLEKKLTSETQTVKYTPEEKQEITQNLSQEYDLLKQSLLDEDGHFVVTPENIKKVRDFTNKVRMSGNGVYASEAKKFKEMQNYVTDTFISGETGEPKKGGFLGFGGQGLYERAIAKTDALLQASGVDPLSVDGYKQKEAILNDFTDQISNMKGEPDLVGIDNLVETNFMYHVLRNNPSIPSGESTPKAAIINGSVVPVNGASQAKTLQSVSIPVKMDDIDSMTEEQLDAFLRGQ